MFTWPRMRLLAVCAAALVPAWFAGAQESAREQALERLEVTMALLPENAADDDTVTRRIELPPANREAASDKPPVEIPGAENGDGKGLDTAAEARERGREFGQDVAEQARENRENAGHGNGPPESPPGPPSDAGNGGRPDNPGGRPTP